MKMVAGVGFEPTDHWDMNPKKTPFLHTRNNTTLSDPASAAAVVTVYRSYFDADSISQSR
jgi:hypothetical protein